MRCILPVISSPLPVISSGVERSLHALRLVEMTRIIPTRIEWGFICLFVLDGEHRGKGDFCVGEAADGLGHSADKVGRRGTGLLGLQGLAEHTFLTEGLILGIADIEQRPSIEENQAGRLDDGLL